MRNVIYGGATSLDNYLARADHRVDWLKFSADVQAISAAVWQRIDAVLMGRKTYQVAVRSGMTGGYANVDNYVFSRTLEAVPPGLTLVRDDAARFVRRFKNEPGRDICLMGGGELARSLFEADLIDEVGLNIHPVLLGGGIPAFHPVTRQIDLELVDCRTIAHDCVFVLYRVRRTQRP